MRHHRTPQTGGLASLRRSWWFCGLETLRPVDGYVTYQEFDLDAQPPLDDVDDSLAWLEGRPEQPEWNVDNSDATPQRRLRSNELERLVPSHLAVPPPLKILAARPELQRRIRSATGCYLDLGDRLVGTSSGGHLLHVLSDQQWVRHWLVYLDEDANESVLTTSEPVGFSLDEDDEWGPIPPDVIPLDGTFDIQVCADSVAEFLYRFWIENELHFARGALDKSSDESGYAEALAARQRP